MAEREMALQRPLFPPGESSYRPAPPVFQPEAPRPGLEGEAQESAPADAPTLRTDRPPWAQGQGRAPWAEDRPQGTAVPYRPPVSSAVRREQAPERRQVERRAYSRERGEERRGALQRRSGMEREHLGFRSGARFEGARHVGSPGREALPR